MKRASWKQLTNDLRAAAQMGVSLLDPDGNKIDHRRLDQLDHEPGESTSNGGAADESIPDSSFHDPIAENSSDAWFSIAGKVFMQTGSAVPVLEGLSARSRARDEASRALRSTFYYLLLLLALTLIGLTVFYVAASKQIREFTIQTAIYQSDPATLEAQSSFGNAAAIPALFAVAAILFLFLLLIGPGRFAMLLGGRRFLERRMSAIVARIAGTLVQSGLPSGESIQLAADLTGIRSQSKKKIDALLTESADNRLFQETANCLSHFARQALIHVKQVNAGLLILLVGGTIAMAYCIIVYLPVISLMYKLTEIETI